MTNRMHYSSEQLDRLIKAHKVICAMRMVDPKSEDGRDLAARLLDECDGNESREYMIKRFTH